MSKMIPVWKIYDNLKIKNGSEFIKIKGITSFSDSSSSTIVKHNHYDLAGRNTAEVVALDENYSITVDVLAEGVDAGNAKLVSMTNKMGEDAQAEMQFENPYTGETITFTATFELHFGDGDNVGTMSGTMHVDGTPSIA